MRERARVCVCVCVRVCAYVRVYSCMCALAWARVAFEYQPGNLQGTSRIRGEYLVIQHVYFKPVRCEKKAQKPRDQHEHVDGPVNADNVPAVDSGTGY